MSDTNLQYRQCQCCGNYFAVDPDSKNSRALFCSPECGTTFKQCCVCGNYFETDKGIVVESNSSESDIYVCSEECAKVLSGHHKVKQV